MECARCGTIIDRIPPEQLVVIDGLTYCSEGCAMSAQTPTGNSSGIDYTLVGGEDPTR